jgi:two-component system, OmpR family, sensor histidine kinase BaeS
MKFGLFSKLFLAFLLTTATLIFGMAVSVHWSFQHGLESYLHRMEIEKLDKLLPVLETVYVQAGGWELLRQNRRLFGQLLHQALDLKFDERPPPKFDRNLDAFPPEPPPHREVDNHFFGLFSPKPPPHPDADDEGGLFPPKPPPPREFDDDLGLFPHEPPPPRNFNDDFGFFPPKLLPPGDFNENFGSFWPNPPPPRWFNFLRRLQILDTKKQVVFGHYEALPNEILRPLHREGQIIGWVGLRPHEVITDNLALSFQAQQRHSYILIAALAVVISILVSWVLARQLLNPIRHIATGARALGSGHYQTRLQVKSSDELGQLATDFNHLAHTLERNEQARRQWIADISHELRTPLAVLRGEIEAMQDGVHAMTSENLKSLHSETLSLGKLVDDLYELALSDLGALDYRKEMVDIADVLDSVVTAFRPRFAAKNIVLVNQVPEWVTVFADTRRLTQLFTNLLENSLRYTESRGRLEISLETTANQVLLDFKDSAPGVPEDSLDKLFERLYRVDKSRSRALGGAGLGLAICRNIVEAHEGRISARHSPLGGVWVRVELPKNG